MNVVMDEAAETVKPMMLVSEWLKGKRQRASALRIADDLGISDIEATSRYRPHATPQRPSFIAMVIEEWHKLVADLSRAFARKRIHRAAMQCRQSRALVMPLDTPKQRLPD